MQEKVLITPGIMTLMEPTSGNLGISFTFIAVQKGHRFVAIIPPHFLLDKQILLRYFGANVADWKERRSQLELE